MLLFPGVLLIAVMVVIGFAGEKPDIKSGPKEHKP